MSKDVKALIGLEEMMGRLASVQQLSPQAVRDMLAAQIDILQLSANDVTLECFQKLRDPEVNIVVKGEIVKMLSALGFFADSVSRQRVALFKEISSLPQSGDGRPDVWRAPEISNDDWEKKFSRHAQLPAVIEGGSDIKQ